MPEEIQGVAAFFRFSNALGKIGVNKKQKRNGGWIMKAKSLLLTILIPVSGLTFLSLPAGAECWMTCPPGSTTTPSATKENGVTATAEPVASPEKQTLTKTPEATAKASPAPAKPKAAPTPAEATVEPVASPEKQTLTKTQEATAKASPAAAPAKPKAATTPAGASSATEPSQVQSTSPAPAPIQDAGALPARTPQPYGDNAAFQSAPAQGATPAPVPIPGPVPGTATMHVIPE